LQSKGGTEYTALEEDADVSAVGAVVSAWGSVKGFLKDIGKEAMPRLRSGLQLQRCAAPAGVLALEAAGVAAAETTAVGVTAAGVTATGATVGGITAADVIIPAVAVGAATTLESDTPRTLEPPDCNAHMVACMLTSLADEPAHPGSVFGSSRCLFCAEVCRRDGGVWPTRAPTTTGFVRCDYWNFPSTE